MYYLLFILSFTVVCNVLHGMDISTSKRPKSRSSSSSSDKGQGLRTSQGSSSPPHIRIPVISMENIPEQKIMLENVSEQSPSDRPSRPRRISSSSAEYLRRQAGSKIMREKSLDESPGRELRKSQGGYSPSTIRRLPENGSSIITQTNNGRNELRKSQGAYSPTSLRKMPEGEHGFLVAAKMNEIEKIKLYLKNKFFNPSTILDLQGNTCSHIAAQNNRFDVLQLLLQDPRTNFCLQNNMKQIPNQLLQEPHLSFEPSRDENGYILRLPDYSPEEVKQLIDFNMYLMFKRLLFARFTLNNTVTKYALKILTAYIAGHFDPNVINGIVDKIESDVKNDTEKQATPLPIESQLPAYANKSFIEEMLYSELEMLRLQSR